MLTFIFLYVPVAASKTRLVWMLAFHCRRVCRMEWLRVFPKPVFLPVLTQMRGIRKRRIEVGRVGVNLRGILEYWSIGTPVPVL